MKKKTNNHLINIRKDNLGPHSSVLWVFQDLPMGTYHWASNPNGWASTPNGWGCFWEGWRGKLNLPAVVWGTFQLLKGWQLLFLQLTEAKPIWK